MNIKIKFPDNSVKDYPQNVTPQQIAESISEGLARNIVSARVNDDLVDLDYKIRKDASIELIKFDNDIGREVYWHSTAHLMAQAVKDLFPDVKVTIGPAIENGFYYDFDKEIPFTDEDLETIEQKMKELSQHNLTYQRQEVSREKAIEFFAGIKEDYKVEILREIPEGETISMYTQGNFTDLCRGPHIINTNKIKAIKLLKTSGAYWRGDSRNKMLQRIYGISFPSNKELKQYLNDLEEAKKRDHRKIGRELDIYSVSDAIGPGLILWHPNGALMRSIIEDYWKKRHFEEGYQVVNSPHIGKAELWQTSGHLDFYAESMYNPIDVEGQLYYLKPMNCPFHIAIYQSTMKSYRDLPLRYAEMGTVYRYEHSGALHGLMRVRGFTQDDAHIICTSEQLKSEIEKTLLFSLDMLNAFGFKDYLIYLATMPDKAVGRKEDWEQAAESLRSALEKNNIPYEVDKGGGAFYGPKIDIKIKDALNRLWQCSTIQFDFNLPERFQMEYVGSDNQPHRPFMVHRALLGSLERFFGTLIEYHSGNFPLWLCPVQVKVIPISEHYEEYALKTWDQLIAKGIRTEVDLSSEKVGYKIREAEIKKIPYMLIVGQKEAENGTVSVRKHLEGDQGSQQLAEFLINFEQELLRK